ncbi:hypothetical protein H072_8139 [Dactylellina haptotyla CBS 200.50]|uniref:TLC domain-containing protein n=1 Tax=Dactylellina haptotyla (strain CBS 200.50) TaxID=1284197 RepID=S8BFS3_DACHA|nr:hypothetical protein H072_8139 [Dactylellina haptotyla CBS 200.50]
MTLGNFKNRHTAPNGPNRISELAPYAGLILTVTLCTLFLTKNYILEPFLPRIYGSTFTNLSKTTQRSFLNQHVAIGSRVVLLALGFYPFFAIVLGRPTLSSPVHHGGKVTMGDLLLVCSQVLVGMYIFELIYRVKISAVSALHHLGTILVAEAAVAISIYGHRDARLEFILCCVWGAFDVIVEFLPSLAIIRYRQCPNDHLYLRRLFKFTMFWTLTGTILESIVAMYLFGVLWDQWELSFKVVTPMLHIAFSAAQLHGSNIFRNMAKREDERLKAEIAGSSKPGSSEKDTGSSSGNSTSDTSETHVPFSSAV